MDALLSRETLADLAANDNAGKFEASSRFEGELGYGISLPGGVFTATPSGGFGRSGVRAAGRGTCASAGG